MRRTALGIGVAALLAFVAAPGVAPAQPLLTAPPLPLTLKAKDEKHAMLAEASPGGARMWGYWGKLTKPTFHNPAGYDWGSYRATCSWLADPTWGPHPQNHYRDDRLLCTVVLSHRHGPGGKTAPHGGSLIAEGLLKMPKAADGLFVRAHECSSAKKARLLPSCGPRTLAITGGTGVFEGVLGHVDLTKANKLSLKTPNPNPP
jgi:hypothetical protein